MNGCSKRDLRIDFFRGLALIIIFIDHIPNNALANFTLQKLGFSDAAEAFVLLAGMSAFFAYSSRFNKRGFVAGADKVAHRALELYIWQLGVLLASFALLYWASKIFADPSYINNIGFQGFLREPVLSLSLAAALKYQPNMLNILPLYIALLLWFPVIYWIMRHSEVLALGISVGIWAAATIFKINLSSTLLPNHGWFLNPFCWQLLLTVGMLAGRRLKSGNFPVSGIALGICLTYLLFALIIKAPWTAIPGLEKVRLIPADLLGHTSKTYLSIWRLTHIMALAYVVFSLVPRQAAWLESNWAVFIIRCGQQALEIFCLGILLSFAAWIMLTEAGTGLVLQLVTNAAGVLIMGVTAWFLAQSKRDSKNYSLFWWRQPQSSFQPDQSGQQMTAGGA